VKPVVALMGPTASGKTGLAVELAAEFPMDIVSVDSALVYRGMDIGTAKPDADTLAHAPHRLVDICDPGEAYSAARFREDAMREIQRIHGAGRVPLLVGGTMLYFRALFEGLSDLPEADAEVRAALDREAREKGWPAMHAELARLDPESARRINPNDPQRIQRALEVIRISGRPMSELQVGPARERPPYRILKLVVCPAERAELHRRIEQRFRAMVRAGFIDEMKKLHARSDLHADLPAMRAVGYRQAWEWLDGRLADGEWQEKAIAATRQLAKRQLTWLRREKHAMWYDLREEGARERVFEAVREFLRVPGLEKAPSRPHIAVQVEEKE
jgi:tRNA dimethylallyltransferase